MILFTLGFNCYPSHHTLLVFPPHAATLVCYNLFGHIPCRGDARALTVQM